MASIRKRSWKNANGKIKYSYEISYYFNGEQIKKGGFQSKLDAQLALPKITQSYSKNITFKELADAYIDEHCSIRCKDGTIKLYRAYLKNQLSNLGYKKAKDIQKRNIDLLVLEMKKNDLSNKSINNILGFLFSVFHYGIKNKWIYDNPVINVDKLPKTTKKLKFLTEFEVKKFISIIQQFPITRYAPLLTALYTGMRISELLALEWSDIDFETNTILVDKQFYRGKLQSTKTLSSIRRISAPYVVIDVLKQLKSSNQIESNIVFCGTTGYYLDQHKFVDNWFKKAVKELGKEDFNFHALRHTYATLLLSNSVSIKFVQEQLGHSTAQTTLNVYSHVLPSVNKKAMNLLDNLKQEHNKNIAQIEILKA